MDRDQQVPVVHTLPAPLPTPTITIHEVDLNSRELLGEGQYAEVYKVIARNPNNHQMETVVIKTNKESESASCQIVKEIRILCQMSDAHVVEFISTVTHPARSDYNAFLMELLDLGNAFSFYTGRTGQEYVHMLSNEQVRTSLCHHVIHAVDYVHRTATVHGDISCNNVLMKHVNGRLVLKLSDFGSAFKVAEGFTYITGTRLYCAEEVFRKRDCTQASDVFSVAATCFFLKYGREVESVLQRLLSILYPVVWLSTLFHCSTNGGKVLQPIRNAVAGYCLALPPSINFHPAEDILTHPFSDHACLSSILTHPFSDHACLSSSQPPSRNYYPYSEKEVDRLRQTCHHIDDVVAQSKTLSLPVAVNAEHHIDIILGKPGIRNFAVYVAGKIFPPGSRASFPHSGKLTLESLECALFESITVNYVKDTTPGTRPGDKSFLPCFKKARVKCRIFKCFHKELTMHDVVLFAKYTRPRQIAFFSWALTMPNPLLIQVLDELPTACKNVEITVCKHIPNDYMQQLVKFEFIQIDEVAEEAAPSLAPLIQATLCCYTDLLLLIESNCTLYSQQLLVDPNPTLKRFQLPIYEKIAFLSQEEIDELGLRKWRINPFKYSRNDDPRLIQNKHLAFIVDTPTHFITLTGGIHWSRVENCIGRRTSKKDVDEVAKQWFIDFVLRKKIEYDRDEFFKFVGENVNNYEAIRNRLETILASSPL